MEMLKGAPSIAKILGEKHCCIESYLAVEKEKCALQFNTTSKHVEQVSEDNDDAADHDDDQGEDEVEVEG